MSVETVCQVNSIKILCQLIQRGMFFFLTVFLCLSLKKFFGGKCSEKCTEKCVKSKSDLNMVITDSLVELIKILLKIENFGENVTQAVRIVFPTS